MQTPHEPYGGGLQKIASYFLSTTLPPRIGLFRLSPNSLNHTGAAVAANLERAGKRVLLLRDDHHRDGTDPIPVCPQGFREGPLVEWKADDEQLMREERGSDILLLLLHPDMPWLPRLLPALALLVLLLPGERAQTLDAYRSVKSLVANHAGLRVGLMCGGDGPQAIAVLDRFALGLRVFLGIAPLNCGTTAEACAQTILNLTLERPTEAYFHAAR